MSFSIISLFDTPLAQSVARLLHANLIIAKFERFADSEIKVTLPDVEMFHGAEVYIFQSTGAPVNDTVLGVAFLAQQLKQAGAKKVILVSPYFGYSRQDVSFISSSAQPDYSSVRPEFRARIAPEVTKGPVAIIAKLLESSGIDELITVELHNPEIKKIFTIPVHELCLNDAIAEHIKRHYGARKDLCLVAPDKGAHEKVAQIALMVGAKMLVFSKERYAADKTRIVGVTGECTGKTAILIDDIVDTAGTAINVAKALNSMEFSEIIGYFAHPVLSGDAADRIEKSPFAQVYVSNTLPVVGEHRKVVPFDISGLLGEMIWKMR